jgi:hypothetical protein
MEPPHRRRGHMGMRRGLEGRVSRLLHRLIRISGTRFLLRGVGLSRPALHYFCIVDCLSYQIRLAIVRFPNQKPFSVLSKFILQVFPFSFLPWAKSLSSPAALADRPVSPFWPVWIVSPPVLRARRAGRVPCPPCSTAPPHPVPHRDPIPSTPCTARASPARPMEFGVKEESSEGFNPEMET